MENDPTTLHPRNPPQQRKRPRLPPWARTCLPWSQACIGWHTCRHTPYGGTERWLLDVGGCLTTKGSSRFLVPFFYIHIFLWRFGDGWRWWWVGGSPLVEIHAEMSVFGSLSVSLPLKRLSNRFLVSAWNWETHLCKVTFHHSEWLTQFGSHPPPPIYTHHLSQSNCLQRHGDDNVSPCNPSSDMYLS